MDFRDVWDLPRDFRDVWPSYGMFPLVFFLTLLSFFS